MDDWEEAQKDGAAKAGAGNMMECFNTAFAAAGYNWEGTCDGTDVCFEGGYKMNGGYCTDTCAGKFLVLYSFCVVFYIFKLGEIKY